MTRHEMERLPCRHSEQDPELKRYRNGLAAYNRRHKMNAKNGQRRALAKRPESI